MSTSIPLNAKTWVFAGTVLISSYNCSATAPDLKSGLNHAYEQLYNARFTLEYPPREEILKLCQEKQIKDCLSAYLPVQEAKQKLRQVMAKDQAAVFEHTVTTINQTCLKPDPDTDQQNIFRCYGAVIALYFFTDPVYDQKIRDLLSHSPTSIARVMLSARFERFYNRPHLDKWITVINALPNEVLTDSEKQPVLKFFKESQQPYEKFGVML